MKFSGKKLAQGMKLGAVFGYAVSTFLITDIGFLPGIAAMGAATVLVCAAKAVQEKENSGDPS